MKTLSFVCWILAAGVCLAQSNGRVRYSAFCGGLDLAGDGYRVTGDMKGGRFSVRPPDGSFEWAALSVAAAVNGRSLAPFGLANGGTEVATADSYALVYTNASARAELVFLPQKIVFRRAHELGVPSLYLCEDDLKDPELVKILRNRKEAKR